MMMETERLKLRRFTPDDRDDFSELIRDKMRSPYAAYDEQFPTDDEGIKSTLAYFAGTDEFFAVVWKAERKVIGFIALNRIDEETRNLGYCIHSAYQGRGYAGEAVAAVIGYAKYTLKQRRLVAGTAEANIPSVWLLQSAGFTLTGKGAKSFAADGNGTPIVFTGCTFERLL
jgi:[ribosomal protein S5]-alanine N-acetyltransferase